MTIEYIERKAPAVGSRAGLVIFQPKTFDTSIKYRLIIFAPGIGGRGDGSEKGLDKIVVNDEGWTMKPLESAVKNDGRYIIVTPQPRDLYQDNEIEEARMWAINEFKDVLDTSRVYLTGLSLGGGGSNKYLAYTPNADKNFAAALILMPGGNTGFLWNGEEGFKNIANSKMAKLWVHCINDTTVAPDASTFPIIKKIRGHKPDTPAQVILFKAGGHTAHKVYGQNPMATPADAFDTYVYEKVSYPAVNDVIGNFINFFELNQIGQPAKFLPRLSDPKPAPIPVPEPPIEEPPAVDPIPEVPPVVVNPPANKIEILYVMQNCVNIKSGEGWELSTDVTVYWSDNSSGKIEIPSGYRNAGTWEDKKRGTYALDIIKLGSQEKGSRIIFGPYKKTQ